MKRFFFGYCFLMVLNGAAVFAQQANTLSLQQCVETALNNNLSVRQSELLMERAEINSRQAKSNLLPTVFGDATHGINQGRSIDPYTNSYINQQVNYATYGVGGSIVLFNGLGLQNGIRQNRLAHEASEMDWQQSKDELTISVIIAYLSVLTGNDLLRSAQQQADVTRKQAERLEILDRQGAIQPSQLYDLKGQLADDEVSIINSQNILNSAKINLAQLMNVPYDAQIKVDTLPPGLALAMYEATPDKIYETALQQLALVKAADLHQQSAETGVQTARSGYYPLLTLNGNINTNYSNAAQQDLFQNSEEVPSGDYVNVDGTNLPVITHQNNFVSEKIKYEDQLNNNLSSAVSLGLTIPILNGLQARHQVQLAKIEEENARAIAQTTKIQLKQDIDRAYFNMTSAYDRNQTLLKQLEAFSESFRQTEVRFNAGANTSVDYLIAKNNMDRSATNLIIARYDFILRTKILDYYQGKALW